MSERFIKVTPLNTTVANFGIINDYHTFQYKQAEPREVSRDQTSIFTGPYQVMGASRQN